MIEKIKCEICGKEFKQIQHRHTKQHGISVEQYSERFPNSPIISESSSERRRKAALGREITWADKISEAVKKSWSQNKFQGRTGMPLSEESRKNLSEKLTGHFVSEETREKIGQAGLGREPWNKNLTKFNDDRLLVVSQKIREWNVVYMTPEKRAKIGQTLRERYAQGMKVPHCKGHFRTDLGKYFRSSWEANCCRIFNFNNIKWEYEPRHFSLYDDNKNLISVYIPDFLTDHWIEVKGHADAKDDWKCNCKRCQRDKLKMLLFNEQYPEENMELICKKEYRELCASYHHLPNWEKSSYDPF